MPILLQLSQAEPVYALQQEIHARVVFRRAAGASTTDVPEELAHPQVLTLRLRHQDGGREDRSPQADGPLAPEPPVVLHSSLEEESLAFAFAAPSRPGEWATELEVRLGGQREVAPEVRFTVLPPAALAVVALASVHGPGAAERILQLTPRGEVLETRLLRHGPGELALGSASRLDTFGPKAAALWPAVSLPGVTDYPFWVVVRRGNDAVARLYGEQPARARPFPLVAAGEPAPLLIGPPLVLDDEGRLLLAWAVGAKVRTVLVQPSGKTSAVQETPLPAPVLRGVAVGGPDRQVTLFLALREEPSVLPPGAALPRVGTTEDLPDPGSARSRMVFPKGSKPRSAPPPLHADWLWALPLGGGKRPAPGPTARVAALPAATVALAGYSASDDAPAALWAVERSGARVEATWIPLAPGKAGLAPGKPERKLVRLGPAHSTDPAALWCPQPGELRLAFLEPRSLVLAGTGEPATGLPLPSPPPAFVSFAGGRLLTFDPRSGLVLH